METAPLKSFATWARTSLIREVAARIAVVLAPASSERVEQPKAVEALEKAVTSGGGGDKGRAAVADKVAYTWFNRIIALRFMDANGYTGVGVVSPQAGVETGQPEVLAEAKRGNIDTGVVAGKTRETVTSLLNGTRRSNDAQGEAYALLLADYCRYWNRAMPFMFEREGDFTELLIPGNLLADDSVPSRAVKVLTKDVCQDVEVIGWLYQFYISERKDEVFAGFKKNQKASADEIPAATQLFTPHWIVRYLVENSLGRLWKLNRPTSHLVDQMQYYIAPADEETDFLKITRPEELKVVDPACGSGHMLTYAFDLLYAIYEEEGYAPADIPGLILTNNLYGIEIDPRAGALAAFALTMKARAKQRTFFNKQVEPNICILDPISFSPAEIDFLLTRGGDKHAEAEFWNQFEHADTFGSLIQPNPELTVRLKQHITQLDDGGDILLADTLEWAERVIEQAEYLSPKYAAAVANPPYMGSKNMGALLLEYAQEHYPHSRYDLFAMFFERGLELLAPSGISAMLTMQSWMFLSRFSDFRTDLLRKWFIGTMAHLGSRAFESIGGEVVQVVAACVSKHPTRSVGSYVRLVGFDSSNQKAHELAKVAAGSSNASEYRADQRKFLEIPGAPIAYWASDDLLDTFKSGSRIEDVAPVRQGFQTGDNDRFMRFWHEVSRGRILFDAKSTEEFHRSGAKFAPYLKGGTFRKWFGNDEYVVAFDRVSYAKLAQLGNKLPSRALYFRESITWSALSSGDFGARYAGVGSTFSAKGACAFPSTNSARDLVLAVFNSTVAGELLEFMGATLDFNVGSLREIPLPAHIPTDEQHSLHELIEELIHLHREDWELDESAPGFSASALARESSHASLSAVVAAFEGQVESRAERVRGLQSTLDARISKLYGLPPGEELAVSLRFSPRSASGLAGTLTRDLVSYAIGCMFGRYSLEEPGLILADQGATVQDYLAKLPNPTFAPDKDNVIPIVDGDWFEDDVVARFRTFLRVAFGEQHFEENLRFVTESLGVRDVRDYFVKSFYKDHVQRYKKRPIYWLFSSPRGSFNALIYLHRYTPSTASTVLNEYLREFRAKLSSSLEQQERLAAGGGTPRQQAAAQKEADRLRKVLLELEEYEHDVLYPLASRQLAIDLDDGVKANYPKFGAALKKIPGLEASDE